MSTTSEIVERLRAVGDIKADDAYDGVDPRVVRALRGVAEVMHEAAARLEELDDDDVLRWGSVNEHGEAPDGSVWRHITFNGEHYTIPFEVSQLLDQRRNKIDELERENAALREALKPFADEAANFACDEDDGETFLIPNSHRLRIVEYEGTITDSMMTIGDFRRAAALAGSGEK
jgi:hypothetical protein